MKLLTFELLSHNRCSYDHSLLHECFPMLHQLLRIVLLELDNVLIPVRILTFDTEILFKRSRKTSIEQVLILILHTVFSGGFRISNYVFMWDFAGGSPTPESVPECANLFICTKIGVAESRVGQCKHDQNTYWIRGGVSLMHPI